MKLADSSIDISIIIPSKNGANTLDRVLSSIYDQNTSHSYEVIVIDSGSTDNTLEILTRYPVRLYKIYPDEFSHSKTRNHGASLADAESYLVFLNQDAVPSDQHWLDNLVSSIESEQEIKAVCAMELNEKKKFFNVSGVASYVFNNSSAKGIYIIEPYLLSNTSDMPKLEQRQLFPFTTVCAMFDKEHFLMHPFNEDVAWGEDLHWAVNNSNRGFRSACTSLAKVYHFHDYSEQELKTIMEHTMKVYADLFGWDKMSLDEFILDVHSKLAPFEALKYVDGLKNSLSWKITAPLRFVHAHLMRWGSK